MVLDYIIVYCWTTVILQTCIYFILTISASSVVPVIGYKENKEEEEEEEEEEDDDDDDGPRIDPQSCHWGFFPRHLTSPCARGRLSLLKMRTRILLGLKMAGA
jgi:hypothetical protein